MSDSEDFSKAPVSITELRSSKTQRAADWTPRDALIHMLRQIDEGKVELNDLVLVGRGKESGEPTVFWSAATANSYETLGLLARVQHIFNQNMG